MQIRRPMAAGAFYPQSAAELKNLIEGFSAGEKKNCIGAVVPHAGYIFSGKTAASVYGKIEKDFGTVVIIGPNHHGKGRIATATGIWQTPLGSVKVDEELSGSLSEKGFPADNSAQTTEHSIEVQLPFLQFYFPGIQIVPVSLNPSLFDVKNCRHLGEAIFESASELGKKILVLASSDFTHYGSAYNYKPFSGPNSLVLKKIKEIDYEAIKAVADFAPGRLIELSQNKTICGYGCISAMLYYAKKAGAEKAEVADYSTSFNTSRNADSIVSYCGILIY